MANSVANAEDANSLIDRSRISPMQMTVFGICFLMNAIDGMDVLVISYAAPVLAEQWSIAPSALGVVFSAALLGMACGAMFIAPFADRIGRRAMIMISVLLTGFAVLGTSVIQSIEALMVLRFTSGLGIGAMLASVATMAAEFAPDRQRNLILVCILAGFPIGATIFGVIAADVIPALGWRAIFVTAGITTLATFPLVWFLLPESLTFLIRMRPANALVKINRIIGRMGHAHLGELPTAPPAIASISVKGLFSDDLLRPTVFLWLAFFMNFAALYFLASWIPKLSSAAGLPLDLAIYAGAIFNLGAVPGIALSGYLSQKFGLRVVISSFLLLTAVVMALFGFAKGSSAILPLFGLIGFLVEGGFVGLYVVAARLYPTELRTTGVGWAIGAGRTGAIAGPFVGGILVAYGLSIGANFRWFAITLVFAGIFTMLIKSDRVS
ncbi:MAG: MFS transporter [Gammaproteobacteria bacterium]|nr:MAG: MFS transporter [Gammaproteobacteria bacterium]